MDDTKQVSLNPEDWPDNLPPCLIHVDKEGKFWHLGAEMIHAGINRLLTDHVELDDKGRYIISYQGQRCFVEVEDTLFVITTLKEELFNNGKIKELTVSLNDGSDEILDPSTISQSHDNVLYARVKEGRFPARFLRSSYYQLAEFVEEKEECFVLSVGGRDYPIE